MQNSICMKNIKLDQPTSYRRSSIVLELQLVLPKSKLETETEFVLFELSDSQLQGSPLKLDEIPRLQIYWLI